MRNLLLLHLREQCGFTPEQIEISTGIPVARYLEYEQTPTHIPATHTELLSVLFVIKQEYLDEYCNQLHLFAHHRGLMAVLDERIEELTAALKRKIERGKQERGGNAKPIPSNIKPLS